MGAVGTVFTFGDLVLTINSSKQLVLTCATWGLNETSATTLGSTWQHILLRLSGGTASVWLDGVQIISASISGDEITPETVQLGGFVGYMDEFVFRHSAGEGAPAVPTQPYNAKLNLSKIGGFGTGADGDVVIEENTTINTRYYMGRIYSNNRFILYDESREKLSELNVGDEIMILLYRGGISHIGQYVFRKIKSIDGTVVNINRNISEANGDDFNLEDIQEEYYEEADGETYYYLLYTVYVIKIPNYNTLVINSGVTINPVSGIVAFRCKEDCTLNGSIITLGMGTARSDLFQMTHFKMIDRFLFGSGGGIFITCGGTFTAPNNARIGASWSGVGTGESISHGACGYGGRSYLYNGGSAGYDPYIKSGVGGGSSGGRGYQFNSSNYGMTEARKVGEDGVKGAGAGGCGGNGANAQQDRYSALIIPPSGGGGGQGNSGGLAGLNTTVPASAYIYYFYISPSYSPTINGGNGAYAYVKKDANTNLYYWFASGGGGGGPGGNGGYGWDKGDNYYSPILIPGHSSGACLVLICEKLNIDQAVISTGGETSSEKVSGSKYGVTEINYRGCPGAGGTGFCYIACEEMI